MRTARIVQAVALMLIVALAASCAATKEYSSKLFAPRTPVTNPDANRDTQTVTLRFLDLGSAETDQEGWVTTDIIMGRDTMSRTMALDKLAKVFPASSGSVKTDTVAVNKDVKSAPVMAETKKAPVTEEPVARIYSNQDGVRSKKTREK